MLEVLVNRLGGLSLPRKSVVRLTDRPDMTLDVYRGRKTTMQQQKSGNLKKNGYGRQSSENLFLLKREKDVLSQARSKPICLLIGSYSYRKDFAPSGSKFFS